MMMIRQGVSYLLLLSNHWLAVHQSSSSLVFCYWPTSISSLSFSQDYDANASLRYFFLVQASYQIHSLGFHVLSMVMVALYGDGD